MIRYLIRALKFAGRVTAWLAVFKIADIFLGPIVNRFCRTLGSLGYPV